MKKQPQISPTKLWRRLNEIEQEVSLGTFDNIIIASFFLIFAISISVMIFLLSDLTSISKIILSTILLFFLIIFSQIILGYLDSALFKNNRFTNKIKTLTIILSLFLFLILVVTIPFFLTFLFPNLDKKWNIIALIIIGYGVPIVFGIYINKKITSFFINNYPHLFLRAYKKMNKENKKRMLKKIKKTLPELKLLASRY